MEQSQGFPVVDLRVTVYDGSHHPVDSSEMAFKVAGSMGFKKAMDIAQPTLLEPIMHVEVTVPDDMVGTIIGDLNARRGRIQGMSTKGHHQIVKALIPLAEILQYAPALTSMTAGKGSYVMEFSGYEEVPKEQTQKNYRRAQKKNSLPFHPNSMPISSRRAIRLLRQGFEHHKERSIFPDDS